MGLEIGADDYLAKPFEPRELSLRIANILKRARPPVAAPVESVRFGQFVFHLTSGELRRGEEAIRLTDRERDMLRVLDVERRRDRAAPGARRQRRQCQRAHRRRAGQPAAPQDRARSGQSADRADRARRGLPAGRGSLKHHGQFRRWHRTSAGRGGARGDGCQRGRRRRGLYHRAVGPLHPLAALGDAARPLCPRAVDRHHAARGAAIDRRLPVRRAAIERGQLLSVVGGDPGDRHPHRRLQNLSAGRQSRAVAPHRPGPARPGGRFPARHGFAAARAEAVLLVARPGAVERDPQADRPAVLDRHRRPLLDRGNPHQARRHRHARLRAARRRLQFQFADLPDVDGAHLGRRADHRHPVPAQPDQADRAAGRRRRSVRQGPRGAEFPAARRARGAARGGGVSWK